MNIHLSILALQVAGAAIVAIIIGAVSGILSIADDHFLRIPFTHSKYGGRRIWDVPEWLLIPGTLLFPIGVVALIIAIGMQIGAWINLRG